MRIHLHERAFIGGALHERGAIVDLPEGVEGPHRAVQQEAHKIDYDPGNGLDANHTVGKSENVPLFDIVNDDRAD